MKPIKHIIYNGKFYQDKGELWKIYSKQISLNTIDHIYKQIWDIVWESIYYDFVYIINIYLQEHIDGHYETNS